MIMMVLMIMRVLMTMMVMIVIMVIRVGQFQVCVSDFFHLLNFGVCYREKNEKIFKKIFGTLLTLAPSHTWRVNKFTSKLFCKSALKIQNPF